MNNCNHPNTTLRNPSDHAAGGTGETIDNTTFGPPPGTCPHCGRCPHCGQSPYNYWPTYPAYWTGSQPDIGIPTTIREYGTCGVSR